MSAPHDELREMAVARLKKRRDLAGHALVFVLVNGFLITIWALATPGVFFWPVFPIAGWGIGLVMHAWDVFRGDEFTEEQIQHEIDRLQHH
jgi:hypothetical protein